MRAKINHWLYWNGQHRLEKLKIWVSWKLPRWLVYWAALRVWANATTGPFSNVEAPGVRMDEAVEYWEKGRGGDPIFRQQ